MRFDEALNYEMYYVIAKTYYPIPQIIYSNSYSGANQAHSSTVL